MEKNLNRYFQEAINKPDEHLSQEVWQSICRENRRNSWKNFWVFFILGISSGLIFIPVFKMLLADFEKSGFYEYLSLAFSSNGTFVSYWKDFILSLLESLPLISIILTLGIVLIFFIFMRYAIKQLIKTKLPHMLVTQY